MKRAPLPFLVNGYGIAFPRILVGFPAFCILFPSVYIVSSSPPREDVGPVPLDEEKQAPPP